MRSSLEDDARDDNDAAAEEEDRTRHPRAPSIISSLRVAHEARLRAIEDWSHRCDKEEAGAETEARGFARQLLAGLQSTAHLGAPNAFRTAICFELWTRIRAKFPRFATILGILDRELTRAVYLTPPLDDGDKHATATSSSSSSPRTAPATNQGPNEGAAVRGFAEADAAQIQRYFAQTTYFTQLTRILRKRELLERQLKALDKMHALMLRQLRNKEHMVDKVAQRWARVLLKQTLVDWRKIIIRKKYTRVLLEKTSGRWARQRQRRIFRQWADEAKGAKVQRMRERVQQCVDHTRDMEELLVKMEAQIEGARLEIRGHREHFDFAKRQILSLEELLGQLTQRVHDSSERRLQELVNDWGRLCLALVDAQLTYLEHMLAAVRVQDYADATLLLAKGEELSDLLRLPADALVLRWINYQLARCPTFRHYHPAAAGFIQNFASDMRCHYVLRHILHRVLALREDAARYSPHGRLLPQYQSPRATIVRATAVTAPAHGDPGAGAALPNATGGDAPTTRTPFASREVLRVALEERLDPPCPGFLSAHVLETEPASDVVFALFGFLVCEHPTLVPLPPVAECPWREAHGALEDATRAWAAIRDQWTELARPFGIEEVTKLTPDLTSPPQGLVRANLALQNAVNTVQYACAKRSVGLRAWSCLHRTVQQEALRVLVRRGRREPPLELLDRRLWRERYMLTTLHVTKLSQGLSATTTTSSSAGADHEVGGGLTSAELAAELSELEGVLEERYVDLRRVYRYYASIDAELEHTDHVLRQRGLAATSTSSPGPASSSSSSTAPGAIAAAASSTPWGSREAQEEARFFHKIQISMSLVEFYVFLKDCRVFGTTRPFPYEFIERVFEQVNADVAAGADAATVRTTTHLVPTTTTANASTPAYVHDANPSEMTPGEFVEALVHIARSRHVRFKVPQLMHGLTLAQRFRRLLDEIVLPHAMQERDHDQSFHRELLAPGCREVFTKHHAHLHAIYRRFAVLEHGPRGPRRMLSVNGLVAVLRHFGLLRENFLNLDEVQHIASEILQLDRESIHVDLEIVSACTTAAAAAVESAIPGAESSTPTTTTTAPATADEPVFLTFAEFLEALAAVACYLRPDAFVPLADKLDDFFTDEMHSDPTDATATTHHPPPQQQRQHGGGGGGGG